MVVIGKEGAQDAVDQPAGEHFRVGRPSFTFQKTTRKSSGGGKFFSVFNL